MAAEIEDFPSVLIGLTGGPGVGKTATSKFLDSIEATDLDADFSFFDGIHCIPMRQLLAWHALSQITEGTLPIEPPATQAEMRAYHEAVRQAGRGAEVFEPLQQIRNRILIVDAIREEGDMQYFRHQLGGYIIAQCCTYQTRKQRFVWDTNDVKHRETKPGSPERMAEWQLANREVEDELGDPGATNIRVCVINSDTILDSEGTKSEMFATACEVVTELVSREIGKRVVSGIAGRTITLGDAVPALAVPGGSSMMTA